PLSGSSRAALSKSLRPLHHAHLPGALRLRTTPPQTTLPRRYCRGDIAHPWSALSTTCADGSCLVLAISYCQSRRLCGAFVRAVSSLPLPCTVPARAPLSRRLCRDDRREAAVFSSARLCSVLFGSRVAPGHVPLRPTSLGYSFPFEYSLEC